MAAQKKPGRQNASPKHNRGTSTPSVAELLLEIGVEELPYQFIVPALTSLKESAECLFNNQRLTFQTVRTMGTPRRLTIVIDGLATKQTSIMKEAMGPSKAVAFDQTGQPTKAALGFAAGQGVAVQDLQVRQTPKGEYLFAVKREEGRATAAMLLETLPQLVSGLAFPKAMKWNEAGVRFARPIRWVTACYGGSVLPIEVAGIKASNQTRGHRVLGGGKWVSVHDATSYISALERQGVIVDPQRRRTQIEEQIAAICHKTGFQLNDDEALLDQAVYTTEWPCAVLGDFKPDYLAVPQEVLITSMKNHQGFFSVRDKRSGKLAPYFIAVANNELKDMSPIRTGNERVLAARLADAKFFFDEDRKVGLEERGKKLSGVTFHQKLGTMAQKQERLVKLVTIIAPFLKNGDYDLINRCRKAAALCKADLLTGIVGEFPELQGIMGGEYAKHEGVSEDVWKAIRDQYLPVGMEARLPETSEGQALSLSDKVDTIVAFLCVGVVPKGSEDPYALRRHALSVVRIIIEGKLKLALDEIVQHAQEIVEKEIGRTPSMLHSPLSFIFERFKFYAGKLHIERDDVMAAVCQTAYSRRSGPLDLQDALERMKALQIVTTQPEFDPLIVGFKRAHRLVEKEQWEHQSVETVKFQHPSESALHKAVTEERGKIRSAMAVGDYDKALVSLVGLKPVIDAFFEAVMVNAEDKAIRSNRLSLLKEVDELFMSFADFSQIVVQGR